MTDIKPALTAEEWRNFLHSERKTPKPADQVARYMDASGASEEEARHAFLHDAAVHLHLAGPFLTREDVRMLREGKLDESNAWVWRQSLAARIDALLPPGDMDD